MFSIEGNIINNLPLQGAVRTGSNTRRRIEIDQKTGLILEVSAPTGVADVVLKDEIIFPGFIDLHVHAREDASHKQDYKEDFVSAGEASINGGVVAFAEMPNNPVPPIDDASYQTKNDLAKKSAVTVVLYAGIGPNTKPLSKKAPYKAFMGPSIGDLFFTSNEELEIALEKYKNQFVSFHCEDPKILEENKGAVSHEAKRPPLAETSAVDFALQMIKKYNLVGKICHCSTVEGINKIIDAKKRGINVTVEVTPHHLYFDETMFGENRKNFQVNPPIRQTKENRLALIALLKKGDIDYLATDHAPHTIEEKEKGISGLTHLDTYGSFATWLLHEHGFTPEEIARVCSYNPANFLNNFIGDKYGKIEKGYLGSLTIIDMNKSKKITKEFLKTKCRQSPFEGITFPGSVFMTIIKGRVYEKE